MELTELRQGLFRLFGIEDIDALGDALLAACMAGDSGKLEGFCKLAPDLESDWLQKIWQYHLADRQDKKQDFTPKSLAALLAALTSTGDTCVDLCAGTGALTIQAWVKNPDRHFDCYELDESLIPFLLFNLTVRNMDSTIYNGDCLTGRFARIFRITRGERFGTVSLEDQCDKQSPVQHQMETERLSLFG